MYALFGQITNGLKKNENIVNSYAEDRDMYVELAFAVDDRLYTVKRGMVRGKQSYLNLYAARDGQTVDETKSSISETQRHLESNIVRCDITMFLRTVFLTADQNYNFYMLKKSDKNEFVEKLFDIQAFGEMYQAMHKDLLKTDREMLSLQNRLAVLDGNAENYKSRLDEFEHRRQVEITRISEQITGMESQLEACRSEEVKQNDDVVEKFAAAARKIDAAEDEIKRKMRDLDRETADCDVRLAKLESGIEQRRKFMAKHQDVRGKLCEKCLAVFDGHYGISGYEAEIRKMSEDVSESSSAKTAFSKQRDALEAKLGEYRAKKDKALQTMQRLTQDYVRHRDRVQQLENGISYAGKELEKLRKDENPYEKMLSENGKTLNEEQGKLAEYEKRHRYLKFAENIVSQDTLRKFIIRDLVVLLNNRIKTYLTKLGAKYYVKFDEDMDYTFITERGSWEFNNFSAGGRMRIMIATSFAFRDFMQIRNGMTSNILVLDEYFDSAISSNCIENIMQILNEYCKNMHQDIYIISHRPELNQDLFDRVITVEKNNNISSIKLI